jgi:hypothetical protein
MSKLSESDRNNALSFLNIIRTETGNNRIQALKELWDLTYKVKEGTRFNLCADEFGFVPTLVQILETTRDEPECVKNATGSIWCLSADIGCRRYLCKLELNLIPALLNVTSVTAGIKLNVTNILLNCSIDGRTHSNLLLPQFGYLDYLLREITLEPDSPVYYNAFQCLFTDMDRQFVPRVLDYGIHNCIMRKLISYGTVTSLWGELGKRCLNILMYISKTPEGAKALRDLDQKSFLYALMDDNEVQGIKACFMVANIYGPEEENSSEKSLLEDRTHVLPLLTSCFNATINYDNSKKEIRSLEEKGFVIGVIQLGVISSALKNLSLNDKNKVSIIRDRRLIANILTAIKGFIHNAPQFGGHYNGMFRPAGGGGDDSFTIENFLELLLQLSFYYEDDDSLRTNFDGIGEMRISCVIDDLLRLSEERKLSFEAKQFAITLHERYKVYPSPCHIMLSYSFEDRLLVSLLRNRLKEIGYDVWTREEGSTLVSSAPNTDQVEIVEEAIQNASMVIVCVSPHYRESSYCCFEAAYARALEQSEGLKIVYLFMQENYSGDGWLSSIIQPAFAYPLWNQNYVESATAVLSGIVGSEPLLANNLLWLEKQQKKMKFTSSSSPHSSTAMNVTTPTSMTVVETTATSRATQERRRKRKAEELTHSTVAFTEPDFETAWRAVERKGKCAQGLDGLVEDLELDDSDDLKTLDYNEWVMLALLMKKPQQKVFVDAIKLEIPTFENHGEINVNLAWTCLDWNKGRYPTALKGVLDDLGVEIEEDLKALDVNDWGLLSLFLKRPQQKLFLEAMKL